MRIFAKPWLIAIISGLASTVAATAQDNAILQGILADKEAQQRVLDAAKKSTVFVKNPCTDAKFGLTGRVAIYATLERDGSGAITKGAWKEEVREDGCGQTRILNVLGLIQGPGKLATMALLPGSTRGDPLLQRDGVPYAMMSAGVNGKDCAQGYVENTEFVSREGAAIAGGKSPPWHELWTVDACGRKAQVPMRFIPDKTGTTITAEPAKFGAGEPKK